MLKYKSIFKKRITSTNKITILISSFLIALFLMWIMDKAGNENLGFLYMVLFSFNALLFFYVIFLHNIRVDIENLKSKNKDF